jgi:hypothetical protein
MHLEWCRRPAESAVALLVLAVARSAPQTSSCDLWIVHRPQLAGCRKQPLLSKILPLAPIFTAAGCRQLSHSTGAAPPAPAPQTPPRHAHRAPRSSPPAGAAAAARPASHNVDEALPLMLNLQLRIPPCQAAPAHPRPRSQPAAKASSSSRVRTPPLESIPSPHIIAWMWRRRCDPVPLLGSSNPAPFACSLQALRISSLIVRMGPSNLFATHCNVASLASACAVPGCQPDPR